MSNHYSKEEFKFFESMNRAEQELGIMVRSISSKQRATKAEEPVATKPGGRKQEAAPMTRGAAKAPAKSVKAASKTKRGTSASMAAQEASADALQDRLEQLEKANAALRRRQQATDRAAKTWEASAAELDQRLSALEEHLTEAQRVANQRLSALEERLTEAQRVAEPAAKSAARRRRTRDIDPGDAVPEGVAVQEPAPLDEEAEAALDHLQHLGDDEPRRPGRRQSDQ